MSTVTNNTETTVFVTPTHANLPQCRFLTVVCSSGLSLRVGSRDLRRREMRLATAIHTMAGHNKSAIRETLPVLLFLCMPVFAVLMHAAFRTREPAFAASLVFTLHLHAMLFIVLIVSDLLSAWPSAVVDTLVTIGGVVFTSWYYYEGALRAYGAGRAETMWKTTVVGLGYGVVYTAGVVAVLMWLLLRA